MRCVRLTIIAVERKALNLTSGLCIFSFLFWHAERMSYIMLSVAYLAVPNFSTFSHKRHDIRKKVLNVNFMFRFCLQLLSKKLSYSKNISARYYRQYI
jgi:hypothetical protein